MPSLVLWLQTTGTRTLLCSQTPKAAQKAAQTVGTDDDEGSTDYALALQCLAAGVPLIYVGEGHGGCTGSCKFTSGALPIQRLADIVDSCGRDGAACFADVVQWAGCLDETWAVLPPDMELK